MAGSLRRKGVSVDLVLETRKTKANFKHAGRVGATYVVLVAPSEWKEGKVREREREPRKDTGQGGRDGGRGKGRRGEVAPEGCEEKGRLCLLSCVRWVVSFGCCDSLF